MHTPREFCTAHAYRDCQVLPMVEKYIEIVSKLRNKHVMHVRGITLSYYHKVLFME